ncbi:DsbA family oxidoreductase [Listeria costaricensis]|uniref:DsbA family oxidoreductase n=1 Tax=Listeria costaricensis TaxID=2026604 RepID=UPI000C06BCE5|nr:DsbA family oxidoreductase [Listeria costaricensis]
MKIDVWSDFACPFCYIGKRNLEKAAAGREDIEIEFHSFELDQNAPKRYDEDIHQLIANKYGKSYEEARAMNDQIGQMAELAGLHYDFDAIQATNTFTAHRLAQFAGTEGKKEALVERLFDAYFTKGAFLNDEETLVELAAEVGLDEEKAREVVRSDEYLAPVRIDETKAMELGINSVPFFLIDNKYALSGAQPVESFAAVLEKAGSGQIRQGKNASGCSDGECAL